MARRRLGMIGGGPGSFIGPIHRLAAELDAQFHLVAGVFSSDANRSRNGAEQYGIAAERGYPDIATMLSSERLDAVAIVTPNHLHLAQSREAIAAGVAVMSDKPATADLAQAVQLREAVRLHGGRYGLAHTYTGYPMIRHAREMVRGGSIGAVRKVMATYPQGWLAGLAEHDDNPQAAWRTDPARSGIGGCITDIGVHAFNLMEYVTGRRVAELCADLSRIVSGRRLDDDANVLLRFDNGAPGVLVASQIATGDRNDLTLDVWGETGGLHWRHMAADRLVCESSDRPTQTLHAGSPYLHAPAAARLPPGHPEGFIGAFTNLYRAFADVCDGHPGVADDLLPGIEAGVRGMAFIQTAVASSAARAWCRLEVPA